MSVRQITILLSVIVGSLACGNLNLELPTKANDFLKTEIIVGGSNIADGTGEMYIIVHLKNSDSSAVADYRPEYNLSPMTGMNLKECTKSTKDGISVCALKSSVAGFKTFALANAKVGLQKTIEFINPSQGQIMNVVAGADTKMTTATGHKVKLTAGEVGLGRKVVTSGGFKVSLTVKTALDAQ